MSKIDMRIKQGDTSPALVATLLDENNAALDLTGVTSVTFSMKTPDGDPKVDEASATVEDAGNGVVKYQWISTDTDEDGRYDGEFAVTWADGTITRFPNFRYIGIEILDKVV